MNLSALPKVLLYEILFNLHPSEAILTVARVNKLLQIVVQDFIGEFYLIKTHYFGLHPFRSQYDQKVFQRLLVLAEAQNPQILKMWATYTDGGAFVNSIRFWAQNLFEYSGSVYTSNEIVSNVTVRAAFAGEVFAHNFQDRLHEDLYGLLEPGTSWHIPLRYLQNFVPSDIFLQNASPRRGNSFTQEEYHTWSKEETPLDKQMAIKYQSQNVYSSVHPTPESVALVTKVGVARPGFATCPVHTLMVFTKMTETPLNLKPFYDLGTIEKLMQVPGLPRVAVMVNNENFVFVEFEGTEGPLFWLQYLNSELSQVEFQLNNRRLMTHAEVLLIDMEDRRAEFGTREKGIDIAYVLFAGKVMPKELKGVVELPEDIAEAGVTNDNNVDVPLFEEWGEQED